MNAEEFRNARKGLALTQAGLALALGLSRKTVVEMEGGKAPIETRTELALRALMQRVRLLEDSFWVDPTNRGTYAVVRRTTREHDHPRAMYWSKTDLMLYGEFRRREDAYRWCAALRLANNPRNTRKLERCRREEIAARARA